MHRGYIKLWRKLRDNPIMRDPGLLQMAIYLLLHARSVPGRVSGLDLQAGQLVTGKKRLATELDIPSSTAYKRLQRLSRGGNHDPADSDHDGGAFVNLSGNRDCTIVTICNWERYQGNETQGEPREEPKRNHKGTADVKLGNTIEECKKKNEENIDPPLPPKGEPQTTLPIPEQEPLHTAVLGFVEYRKKSVKIPLTPYALGLVIKRVERWFPGNPRKQAEAIDYAVEHTWQGVYWPREWGPEPNGKPPQQSKQQGNIYSLPKDHLNAPAVDR